MDTTMLMPETRVRITKHFPKNNSFCYRWRVVDEFNKTVDRDLYHLQLNGGMFHKALINERIMALYKMSYRRTKNDFMSQITQGAMEFLQGRRYALAKVVQEESMYTASMRDLVESMFNVLLSCSVELNTVLGFSELFVASTDPEISTTQVGNRTKVSSLRARFSTSYFSLLIHGQKDQVLFYILPVEDLIGLSPSLNGYEPFQVIQAKIQDNEVTWEMEGEEVKEDRLEDACLRGLQKLIASTQSVLSQMQAA